MLEAVVPEERSAGGMGLLSRRLIIPAIARQCHHVPDCLQETMNLRRGTSSPRQ
jgi:hypothetical protein